MKTVVVLGSTGTIGSAIKESLIKDSFHVISPTRKELDLTDYLAVTNWLEKNHCDVIINCAIAGGKQTVNNQNYDEIRQNITAFLNLYNNSRFYSRYINIGSGAEFDTSTHICSAKESDIFESYPKSSYGVSKNIISRIAVENDNFFTLRLFGCFSSNEPNFRILKRMLHQELVEVENKKFDFFSFNDFYSILKYYILEPNIHCKDVNCVYVEKYYLSTLLETFKTIHNLKTDIQISDKIGLDYTGSGELLSTLPIKLEGLVSGLEKYI